MKIEKIASEPQLRFETMLPENKNGNSQDKIDMISLFSGCGGMDLGFHLSGFNIKWANDFDKMACATYAKNIGNHIVHADITELDYAQIPNADYETDK